jgi:hypothetical protein
MMKKINIMIFCLILVATTTANAAENTPQNTTKKMTDKNDITQGNIILSLWMGRISDVDHQGGWTPTIHFHAISVLRLINQYPWVIWLRNTDEIIPEYGYIGWIGPTTICALVDY